MKLEDLKKEKKELEEKISQMLSDFITEYDVTVEDTDLLLELERPSLRISEALINTYGYEKQTDITAIIKIMI